MGGQELLERYFLARILWWREAILNLEEVAVLELINVLKSVEADLANAILNTAWQEERALELAIFCDELLAAAGVKVAETVAASAVEAGVASLANWNTMLTLGGAAASVNVAALSRTQLRSWFQDTPLGGHTLNEWVKKAFDEGVRKSFRETIQKSAIKGHGYGKMTKELLQEAVSKGQKLTEREAITLVRTYTQTANVEAQRAVYRQNTDVVYAQKWVSVLDNRVCPRCAALDGVIYKNGEEMPPIPLHPRCRCLLLPCTRVDELGVTSEDLERVARPWVVREPGNIDTGGKRKILLHGSTKENFGGWYHTLPEAERVRIVGPVRAKLLEEGKITFGELVDKSTGQLRTLHDMGFSESGRPH